mmetsp:Transcript_21637/g.50563  ORF Transcript_21637/g.50563 Transcript_21637/m.50563 type:complete len:268 (-) Transcript_21637:40-843(-)
MIWLPWNTSKRSEEVAWDQFGLLLFLFWIIYWSWSTYLVYPLRLLVVFMHETSHALAVAATGGHIHRIQIDAAESGVCVYSGGNGLLILNAGYLGSLCWGGIILMVGSRAGQGRLVSSLLGVGMMVIGVHWVRPVLSFGMVFTLLTGALLILSGWRFPTAINDVILRIIGLTSCMYAVLDIKSDVLDHPTLPSDAALLARLTGLPTLFWGAVWIVVAVASSFAFVMLAVQGASSRGADAVGAHLLDSGPRKTQSRWYSGHCGLLLAH